MPQSIIAASSQSQNEVCPSCSISLTSVITTIIITTGHGVIFVLVQISVCKCHLKFDQQEGRGRCMIMQVDGGVAVSDLPIWRFEQEEEEARGHM